MLGAVRNGTIRYRYGTVPHRAEVMYGMDLAKFCITVHGFCVLGARKILRRSTVREAVLAATGTVRRPNPYISPSLLAKYMGIQVKCWRPLGRLSLPLASKVWVPYHGLL